MRRALLPSCLALAALAAPVWADLPAGLELPPPLGTAMLCVFTRLCVEDAPCTEARLEARLELAPQARLFAPDFLLSTADARVSLGLVSPHPEDWPRHPARFTGHEGYDAHLLSRAANGAARYTVHQGTATPDGTIGALTRIGTCKEFVS